MADSAIIDLEKEVTSLIEEVKKIHTSNLDSKIVIDYNEDRTQCLLTITQPMLSGSAPTVSDVVSLLEKEGVKEIDLSLIEQIVDNRLFDKRFTVARGRSPTEGDAARYIYRFERTDIDVIPGQLLAIKKHAGYGEPGITVKGEEIPGIKGADFQMIAGKNTAISRDRTRLYATSVGRCVWKENRCDVEPLLLIDGDLKEDIDFSGKVEIMGKAIEKSIKAGGDIRIVGDVERCRITTGGTLTAEQGITESKVRANGDIIANFAASSELEADHSIIIRTGVIDCQSSARSIFVAGKKGIIMSKGTPPPPLFSLPIVITKGVMGLSGGKAFAERVIDVEVLGSVEHKSTEVRVKKGGRVSASFSIYPKTKIYIGVRFQEITKPEEALTFVEEKGKVVAIPYTQAEAELAEPLYGPTRVTEPPSLILEREDKEFASRLLGTERLDSFEVKPNLFLFFPREKRGPWNRVIEEEERRKEEEARTPGKFSVQNLPEGLYLTVTPPGSKGKMPPLSELAKLLVDYKDLDISAIKKSLREKRGVPVKIAERQYIPEIDGRVKVEIADEDRIRAKKVFLTIGPGKDGARSIPEEDILRFIKRAGVKVPINLKKIRAALKRGYHKPFVIAEAELPTKGDPARYIYKFEEDTDVIPGQILAIKSLPKLGKPGRDCRGDPISGILGEDFAIQPGKNTFLSPDGRKLYSVSFGKATWTNHRCDVEMVKEVEGDLEKDLNFDGKIVVSGSVKRGVSLTAGGSIIIRKEVEPQARLVAGGNVEVDSDISGTEKQEVSISAKGDVVANSASWAKIECGGSIILRTGMIECISSAKAILITGRRGIIMTKGTPPPELFSLPIAMAKGAKGIVGGGRVFAEEFIDVEQIGSVEHKRTEVRVGEGGRISVSDSLYPKVRMGIGRVSCEIGELAEGATFCVKGRRIERIPYEPSEIGLTFPEYSEAVLRDPPSILMKEDDIEKASEFLGIHKAKLSSFPIGESVLFFPKEKDGPWKKIKERIEKEAEERERENGSFKIENTPDGLYISVSPPGKRGEPVSYDEVVSVLSCFLDIDGLAVKRAIDKADGMPVKVAPRQYIPEIDGSITVKIVDEGNIKAKYVLLTIGPEKPGGRQPRLREILLHLDREGIKFGIDEDKIRVALKKRYNKPFKVASAKLPEKGDAARFIYRFDEEIETIPGQILAKKEPAKRGESGRNCLGEEIEGLLGDDFEIVPGRNTYLSSDGNTLYASASGLCVWRDNRCDVERVLKIDGDLDHNIEFDGKVVVTGSVKEGVRISASCNIEVKKDVEEGAELISKESILVDGHIDGTEEVSVRLSAEDDIIASSASYSVLKAGGTILMRTGMICSSSAKRIYIVGKEGVIMAKGTPPPPKFTIPVVIERGVKGLSGGVTEADILVSADIIGSVSHQETEIKVGEGGRVAFSSCLYPNTKISIGTRSIEPGNLEEGAVFYEEQGKIVTKDYEKEEVVLTEPKISSKRRDYPPSLILQSSHNTLKMASKLLDLKEDEIESFDLIPPFVLLFPKGVEGPWLEVKRKMEEEKRREEERSGDFEIESLPEGLFLKVSPPGVRGVPVALSDVMEKLSNYSNVNIEKVKEVVEKQEGIPIKVGLRQYIEDIDSRVKIEIVE
jgi:uncharacterized protein (DUF342 family)